MSNFYMLAGTVNSDDSLERIQQLLSTAGLQAQIDDDEIEIEGEATLFFRSGFDHEYILVGDSSDKETLKTESRNLSEILKSNGLRHGYEIYDMDNQMIDEFEYQP